MDTSQRAPGYDLFKLIVAILLLVLFFVLLRRPASPPLTVAPTRSSPTEAASATASVTLASSPVEVLATSPSLSPTPTPRSLPPPTETSEPAATDPVPSPTATAVDAPIATPLPSPTEAPVIEPTLAPAEGTPTGLTSCDAALSRSRLQAGTTATILRRLNFRSSPGIRDNWLRTNLPGTQVQVMSGPECLPHISGAYVWWQVRLPNGDVGWSAEGSIHGTFYFMEPE